MVCSSCWLERLARVISFDSVNFSVVDRWLSSVVVGCVLVCLIFVIIVCEMFECSVSVLVDSPCAMWAAWMVLVIDVVSLFM